LGELEWRGGRRDSAYEHVARAVELLEDAPPSPSKARVLSEVSRYQMLGGRHAEAVESGREALRMAERFGLDEVRAHALNNIGSARGLTQEGQDDLRASIEIATASRSLEALRGINNLGVQHLVLGDFRRAREVWESGMDMAERFPGAPNARWLLAER